MDITNGKKMSKKIPKELDEKFTTMLLDDQVDETEYAYEEAKKLRNMYHNDRETWDKKNKEYDEKRNELKFEALMGWTKEFNKEWLK